MKGSLFVLFALCVCLASANWPVEWTPFQKSLPDAVVSVTVALKQQNLEEFNELFERITTPGSPEYGQYRTISELTDIIAPSKEEQNFVVHFFSSRGCSAESFGDFVSVECAVSVIEEVFNAKYFEFKHEKFEGVLHRSVEYPTIPEELEHIATFVTGISTFPANRMPVKKVPIEKAVATDKWVIPQTLRNLYNIPDSAKGTLKTNSMAVAEFGFVAGVSMDDLKEFNQLTDGPTDAQLAYTVGTFAFTPVSPIDGESTLDVQYIMGVAPGVPTSFWTINGWMYDFTTLVQSRQSSGKPVPLVFSMSYGWAEADQCAITGNGASCGQVGGSDTSYIQTTSANFQKLGASGITLIAAAGDAGAASKENLDCNLKSTPIQPNFPASSPYITTVGGTMLQNGGIALSGSTVPPFCQEAGVTCAAGGTEIVCSVPQALITTGGGFSNVFSRPSYQNSAVSSWKSSSALKPPTSYWNANGRAYPDVAGLAHKYLIVENGQKLSVDGTSASAPVTAGIIALVNENRLKNKQSPVGFVNPALYAMSSSNFNDITFGNNTGTEMHGFNQYCFTYGFGASRGWDPCTGLGTPNYQSWNNYWKNN